MNRIFTTVALQSIVAAAVMVAASSAGAATSARDFGQSDYAHFETQNSARFVSTLDADQVRAAAREAVRQGLTTSYEGMTQASANDTRIVSTVSRDQVRAEAREAVRTGQVPGYEDEAQAAAGHDGAVRVAAAR